MQVFKFGGASVKDAQSIQNIKQILSLFSDEKILVVISAMGKTTNALEEVVNLYIAKDEKYIQYIKEIREYHLMVAEELLGANHKIQFKLFALFDKVEAFCSGNTSNLYSYIYDQIIATGELASTLIVSEYLNAEKISNQWIDARDCIRTDNHYTEASVNWEKTKDLITESVNFETQNIVITQGFIAATKEKNTTTLGREGSDYSAAIFANILNVEKISIWKDVDGIFSADPKQYTNAVFIEKLSYKEASEMTYYGAKVIHPKTIRPLQNKAIDLTIRSFKNVAHQGTLITQTTTHINYPPIIVNKENQILFSFKAKDFSFSEAQNLRMVLKSFDKHRLKVNIIQTGALTLSIVTNHHVEKVALIKKDLKSSFKIKFNTNLNLLTIRHYDFYAIEKMLRNKEVLLEQRTRETMQVLMR